MATFHDLPSECIVMILAYLRPHHVEKVAKIYNKRVTGLCLPLLRDRFRAARNHRILKEFFGNLREVDDETPNFEDLLGGEARFTIPECRVEYLEYLHMDGSLKWLVPLDQHTAHDMAPHWLGEVDPNEVQRLREITRGLGIYHAVPDAFWRLMDDGELQRRMPSVSANFFILSRLRRILPVDLVTAYRSSVDVNALRRDNEEIEREMSQLRAYILDFCSDQQGCGFWHLYLDSEGRHGVLRSPWMASRSWETQEGQELHHHSDDDSPDLKLERLLNVGLAHVPSIHNASLEATDFETWSAFTYSTQRACFLEYHLEDSQRQMKNEEDDGSADLAVPVVVAEFLETTCTEEGRKRQLLA